jgi:hypothetical protein
MKQIHIDIYMSGQLLVGRERYKSEIPLNFNWGKQKIQEKGELLHALFWPKHGASECNTVDVF